MKKKLKVLALFDAIRPTTIDQDLSKEMKTEDWKTEANVLAALGTLGHATEHLAIFDDLDLLRQKLESFAPDVIFNLADQFKNNRGFDQNIVSFLEMQGVPFTGCGATGLAFANTRGSRKRSSAIIAFTCRTSSSSRAANGSRGRSAQVPDPGEAGEGRGVLRDFAGLLRRDRRAVPGARDLYPRETWRDVIAEEYIEGRELYVSLMGI